METFAYPPTPQILQWLAAGQLANRLQRSVRLWVLLNYLYNTERNWTNPLPKTFSYPDLRDRLFASTHSKSDRRNAMTAQCRTSNCVCHKTLKRWVFSADGGWGDSGSTTGLECNLVSEPEWQQEIMYLTGFSAAELKRQLQQRPFATVHRSIRDDLKQLTQLGWLQAPAQGRYQCLPAKKWPAPPLETCRQHSTTNITLPQTWELLQVLESISFVQPNLEVVVRSLWEQLTDTAPNSRQQKTEPAQRIFIHLDYIICNEMQEQVDTYQEQIEQLWHRPPGGVVQFNYWIAKEERQVKVTVYPVCLHYVRRAKYLSAYGIDPKGKLNWHNYRLDRIASKQLTVLTWGDPNVPKQLKEMWHTGCLPTPAYIQTQLDAAWGFNFYLPSALLILRFPPAFARGYVDNTVRHPTFQRVDYQKLPQLIQQIPNSKERQTLLQIIQQRHPQDAYYQATIRTGDINVLMRLRDWRPNGEVIAPLSLRQSLAQEAAQELGNYQ